MKTTATTGKPRRVKAPVKKSESHIGRMRHSAKRAHLTPSWPWPPIRLTDRLANPDAVTCPHCGRVASFRRSWCELCGRATS